LVKAFQVNLNFNKGNGDNFGITYNGDKESKSVGYVTDSRNPPVGPTITSVCEIKKSDNFPLKDHYFISEGAIPVQLYWILASGFATLSKCKYLY
jgi:hypothetical protein